jgi:hypothetical protein
MGFSSKMVCERNSLGTNGAKASTRDAETFEVEGLCL